MERRELLKMIALLTGGAVIGGEVFLSGCNGGSSGKQSFEPFPWPELKQLNSILTPEQIALLDEVAETIIPATDTPGAKAAETGKFMNAIVSDCYTESQQKAFTAGITTLQEACKKAAGKSFMECDAKQRHDFLVTLEKEAKEFNKKRDDADKVNKLAFDKENSKLPWNQQKEFEAAPSHYYTMMKQLTLWGYFTSEIGATKALRNVPVPGKFDGSMPYKKGDKAFA